MSHLIHPSSILLQGIVWSVVVCVCAWLGVVVKLGGHGGLSRRRRSSACGWPGPTNTNETNNNWSRVIMQMEMIIMNEFKYDVDDITEL